MIAALAVISSAFCTGSNAQSQPATGQTGSSSVAPPSGQSSYPPAVVPSAAFPASLSLGLAWNESYRSGISVPINNTGSTALTILGVQTSANLFVESFPPTVAAGAQGTISLIYFSRYNATGDSDVVRVLTANGEVDIPVAHARAAAFQASAQQLNWSANGAPTPQSVTVTMTSSTETVQAATALGTGNSATVTSLGGSSYQITVTPGSTSAAGSFPVIVTLSPTLPDGPIVINCNITAP